MNQFPFKVTASAAAAGSSPSVYLEKGRYRLRKLSLKTTTGPTRLSTSSRPNAGISRWLIVLLLLLAVACITSFGLAYYLFTTRWAGAILNDPQESANEVIEVIEFTPLQDQRNTSGPDETFLAYIPHSGFHNQRIALENALTLSYLLNRTLVLPPIRLGSKPLRYQQFHTLRRAFSNSGKEGLKHCGQFNPAITSLPPECLHYFDYTYIPWEWLIDIETVDVPVKVLPIWNFTATYLESTLRLRSNDVLTFEDTSPYHFRFLDDLNGSSPSANKFKQDIYISELRHLPHKVLQFGSLFGTSRLRLRDEASFERRRVVRNGMLFANPTLNRAAQTITDILGPSYIGIHIRVGDGRFLGNESENVRALWLEVVQDVLGYSSEESILIEGQISDGDKKTWTGSIWSSISQPCSNPMYRGSLMSKLNTPMYIATDAPNPQQNKLLQPFLDTFPCIFFLDDFKEATYQLDGIVNGYDGLYMGGFLRPFLDAMVLGHAEKIVITPGSTFSSFVKDFLWRRYHGLAAIERG